MLSKDWRQELRLGSAEEDARLALWGYGGKLQSKEAYNQVVAWAEEMGIPFDQVGIDLPPRQHLDQYFAHNKVVADTSGSSIDSRLYLLENPDYLQYLVENNIRTDDLSGESIEALRLRVKQQDNTSAYDDFGDKASEKFIQDDDERREARKAYLEANPEFRDDRRRVEMYDQGATDPALIEKFVKRGLLVDEFGANSPEVKLFGIDNPDLLKFGQDEETFSGKV